MLHHNNAANKMEAPVRPDDLAHFRCSRQSFDRAAVLQLWWDSRNHNARRPGAALDGLTATPLLPRLPILLPHTHCSSRQSCLAPVVAAGQAPSCRRQSRSAHSRTTAPAPANIVRNPCLQGPAPDGRVMPLFRSPASTLTARRDVSCAFSMRAFSCMS